MVQPTTDAPLAVLPIRKGGRCAFTLIELLVTVVILLMLLAGVGLIFRTTSTAVSMSQANMELLDEIRAAQDQMQRDFSSIDHSAFLVIRTRKIPTTNPNAAPTYCDQVSFVANECFTSREIGRFGIDDQTVHSGLIWYGHLVVEGVDRPGANYIPTPDQAAPLVGPLAQPLNVLPSASVPSDLILGRHVTLLVGPTGVDDQTVSLGGQILPAIPLPSIYAPAIDVGDSVPAHICSSRINLASVSTNQMMQIIGYNVAVSHGEARVGIPDKFGRPPRFTEVDTCFRFKTLLDPWATEVTKDNGISLPNGISRMQSIFLQSCESFHVEVMSPGMETFSVRGNVSPVTTGDDALTIYSSDTPADQWPRAVRITICVVDPAHRMPSPRTFQQIIPLLR